MAIAWDARLFSLNSEIEDSSSCSSSSFVLENSVFDNQTNGTKQLRNNLAPFAAE